MKTKFLIYFNSVITKYNTEEFISQTYFDRAKELGSNAVSFTFVEDRSDVNYSLLPDRKTMIAVCESILDYGKKYTHPKIMIPLEYFNKLLTMEGDYMMNAVFGKVYL